jgi:hypothetical protein
MVTIIHFQYDLLPIAKCRTFPSSDENSLIELYLQPSISDVIISKSRNVHQFVTLMEIVE